ncbi:glycosyltransferase family 25 protein, partial [Xylariaceae sp. FL0662B]
MLPFRRVCATICALTSLFYIYWWKLLSPHNVNRFPNWTREDVLNSTLGFSKIFVINLPSRTDRRDAMALTGAVSNLSFTWIDGVSGDQVPESITSPGDGRGGRLSSGARGSWRSHMNALETIVHQNLDSALILEDDVDWDVRLKAQLYSFTSASRTWLRESKTHNKQIELKWPSFLRKDGTTRDSEKNMMDPPTAGSAHDEIQSTYGDGWDILWLGHCGADFPPDGSSISPLRVVISDDKTVPAPKHLKPHPFARKDKLGEMYPSHTRVVHAASGNICSLAYAVSQQGARKLLWEFGEGLNSQWDIMLQRWCQGEYVAIGKSQPNSEVEGDGKTIQENRDAIPVCLTVQPPLFSHHYAKGGASDIQGQGGGYARGTGTPYIRLSVRENLKLLV